MVTSPAVFSSCPFSSLFSAKTIGMSKKYQKQFEARNVEQCLKSCVITFFLVILKGFFDYGRVFGRSAKIKGSGSKIWTSLFT